MPTPRYILCSEVRLVDQVSGLVTHVNVLELVTFTIYQPPKDKAAIVPGGGETPGIDTTLTAVWMKDEADGPEQVFDIELAANIPGRDEPAILNVSQAAFGNNSFLRSEAKIRFATIAPGLLRFTSRMRPHGTETWVAEQQFTVPIVINLVDAPPPA
jgi:hypothetical protein